MFIIVGLGNPGQKFENTRHNIGWDVIDELADEEGIGSPVSKFQGVYAKGVIAGQKCVLVKPLTFMNLSGECVREVVDYFKVDEKNELIVISDDTCLDVGRIRIRKRGSSGGHNGLKNIIANLGHEEFIRVRMGVGEKPKGWDLADYVLGHFSKEEREMEDAAAKEACDAIRLILTEGPDAAMNEYNAKKTTDD